MKTKIIYHVTEKCEDGIVLDMFFTTYKKAKKHVFTAIELFDEAKGFYFHNKDVFEDGDYLSVFLHKHENGKCLTKHYGITGRCLH